MKKIIPAAIFLVCLLSFSGKTQELKLDDVLSKYYQAIGTEHIKDWKTITMSCKTTSNGMEFPITITTKRPGKIRVEFELQGSKMIQAFDGQAGWSVVPWSGSTDPQDMTPDEVKTMKEQGDIEGSLYNWKEKGHKAELIGREDMDGTSVYKIKVILADENVETYFIDAENFVPLKVASVSKIQGNESESETYPGNYKEVNGAMMPFAFENKFKGQTVSHLVIDKYEIDKEVNDSLFVRPAKKK